LSFSIQPHGRHPPTSNGWVQSYTHPPPPPDAHPQPLTHSTRTPSHPLTHPPPPPARPHRPPQRLLDYIKPQYVHIMEAGRITQTGGMDLVDQLEAGGYAMLSTA